jgi:hypothetical protein
MAWAIHKANNLMKVQKINNIITITLDNYAIAVTDDGRDGKYINTEQPDSVIDVLIANLKENVD